MIVDLLLETSISEFLSIIEKDTFMSSNKISWSFVGFGTFINPKILALI